MTHSLVRAYDVPMTKRHVDIRRNHVLKGLRHLAPLYTPYPNDRCEMGDDDGCAGKPAFWLTAPDSYVKPMILCAEHAQEERDAWGTRDAWPR